MLVKMLEVVTSWLPKLAQRCANDAINKNAGKECESNVVACSKTRD
jgi:hypothetical protein